MNAQIRQKIVYATLPLAMVWGAYNLFWDNRPEALAPPPNTVVQPATQVISSAPPQAKPDWERIDAAAWGADPFRTLIKKAAKPTDKPKEELKLILSGIVFNEKSPMAVINKKMVRTGDTIGGVRVVSINRKTVTVERNGKRYQLTVTKG